MLLRYALPLLRRHAFTLDSDCFIFFRLMRFASAMIFFFAMPPFRQLFFAFMPCCCRLKIALPALPLAIIVRAILMIF